MERITKEEFYKGFLKCIKNGLGKYKEPWRESRESYHNGFTTYINKKLMPKYLENLSVNFSNEYYRFDVSYWEQKKNQVEDICKKVKMKPHLWDFMIAFEHENNLNDWYDEVIKLLFVDCPLKVVVGYNKYSKRYTDNNESDSNKLDALCKILNKLQRINELLRNKEFLIIIGNGGTGKKNKEYESKTGAEYFDYKGYSIYIENGKAQYKIIDKPNI